MLRSTQPKSRAGGEAGVACELIYMFILDPDLECHLLTFNRHNAPLAMHYLSDIRPESARGLISF